MFTLQTTTFTKYSRISAKKCNQHEVLNQRCLQSITMYSRFTQRQSITKYSRVVVVDVCCCRKTSITKYTRMLSVHPSRSNSTLPCSQLSIHHEVLTCCCCRCCQSIVARIIHHEVLVTQIVLAKTANHIRQESAQVFLAETWRTENTDRKHRTIEANRPKPLHLILPPVLSSSRRSHTPRQTISSVK